MSVKQRVSSSIDTNTNNEAAASSSISTSHKGRTICRDMHLQKHRIFFTF